MSSPLSSRMKKIVWLHDFCLRDPSAFINGEFQAVFVLDEELFETEKQSLKRLEFQVSAGLDAGADVYQGKTVEVLKHVAELYGAKTITSFAVRRPWFDRIADELGALGFDFQQIETPDFAPELDYDLGRFFRYWNKAKKSLLKPD